MAEKVPISDRKIAAARAIHQRLLEIFSSPDWGAPLPPLDELVSTILSQNTNDANRDRAFKALRRQFPTWEAVRDATPDEVVAAIRPAGLANQKGPRIQAVLREITAQRGALDLEFLRQWPAEQHRHRAALFIGQACFPGGHAHLPRDRPPGAAPG
jgi:endonuclease-3